jgi:hypothetical protein
LNVKLEYVFAPCAQLFLIEIQVIAGNEAVQFLAVSVLNIKESVISIVHQFYDVTDR